MTEMIKIRNIAVVGTFGSGKTTLLESLLYYMQAIPKRGSIEMGDTVSDFDPDEIRRHMSLNASLAQVEWEGMQYNFIDTPGYSDFIHETVTVLNIVDEVIFVLDPLKALDVTTQNLMTAIKERNLPCLLFVNKLDLDQSDYERFMDTMEKNTDFHDVFHLSLPLGQGQALTGTVEVLEEKGWVSDESLHGHEAKIPPNVDIQATLETLVEEVSESNDQLLDTYLETGHLPIAEVQKIIHDVFKTGKRHLLLSGSAKTGVGLHGLVAALRHLGTHPDEHPATTCYELHNREKNWQLKLHEEKLFSAYVFKTLSDPYLGKISLFRVLSGSLNNGQTVLNANRSSQERIGKIMRLMGKNTTSVGSLDVGDIGVVTKLKETQTGDTLLDSHLSGEPFVVFPLVQPEPIYSVSIQPLQNKDENKLSNGLHKLKDEDPFFTLSVDPHTHLSVLGGVGQTHVELLIERLKTRYEVEVMVSEPRVPYRETITVPAKAQGKHKKQTGGHGQFGDVWLRLEPQERGEGFVFESKIVGGVVPKNYWSAVEKGLREIMAEGILTGHPITDLKVTLYDGSHHAVDSSDLSFQLAAKIAFKAAFEQAKPTLLEPVMKLEITVPEEMTGAVLSDLSGRRGQPLGMESISGLQHIQALLILSEVLHYAPALTSVSHGQGTFSAAFSHYTEVLEPQKSHLIKELNQEPAAVH